MATKLNLSEEDLALIIAGRLAVDEHDTRYYYNDQGQLHRDGAPAVVVVDSSEYWYQNGLRHRDNGPAVTWMIGVKKWYQHGVEIKRPVHLKDIWVRLCRIFR